MIENSFGITGKTAICGIFDAVRSGRITRFQFVSPILNLLQQDCTWCLLQQAIKTAGLPPYRLTRTDGFKRDA